MKKLSYIDTMRGLAILLVIACHCAYYVYLFVSKESKIVNFLIRGQMGVQLFFIASALTLCLSAEKRGMTGENLPEFFMRRLFRIAPMYYLGILIYFGVNYFFINRYDAQMIRYFTPVGILSNVFFLHGFSVEYNNTIVPGGWSIGTEVAFYLCFPYLFVWLREKSFEYVLKVVVFYSLLAGLIFFYIQYIQHRQILLNNTFYYYNFFNQLPVFLWGFLLYKQVKAPKVGIVFNLMIMVVGFLAFYLSWNMERTFNISYFLVPFFAGMTLFAFGNILHHYNYNFRIIDHIGRLSYSIYIFHFLSTHFFFPYLYEHYFFLYVKNPAVIFMACFTITIIPAYVFARFTWRFIEQPFISLGNKIINQRTNPVG